VAGWVTEQQYCCLHAAVTRHLHREPLSGCKSTSANRRGSALHQSTGCQATLPGHIPHSLHSNDTAHRRTLFWQLAVSLPIPHIRLVEQLHPHSSVSAPAVRHAQWQPQTVSWTACLWGSRAPASPLMRRGTQPAAAAVGVTSSFALAPGSLALPSAVVSIPNMYSSPYTASHALVTLRSACHNCAVLSTKEGKTCLMIGHSVLQSLLAGYDCTPVAPSLNLQLLS